jgi:2-iminobutanoate/2-iminopropanoate deaminase
MSDTVFASTKKLAHRSDKTAVGGPYTPAISVGETVYVSGQGPVCPATLKIIGETFEEQVEATFQNVVETLRAADCSLDDCVKVNVFVDTMDKFDRLNAIYRTKFVEPFPVRTTVAAKLWNDIQVEIDVIAVRGCGQGK